ncbi:hypothetical protein FORC48_2522 [Bacillus cereus]|uniref:hypothetical protein n=1 Tax=Bacillus cereus TaxID=1396 RepID=UPI000B600E83|nr:hypothetical protein [Bacillus cereus]ASI83608.1 hypothetical protein FORC48_2522 [Bacillus cereus]
MQEIMSVAKEFGLDSLVDVGMDLMPYVSNFRNMVKFNRLERRMKEHSDQLKVIGQLSKSSSLAPDYITERIFPIVLADLIEEHEDAKISLLLNGFENVFINENKNESIVINYYDTLRNLRYEDIMRFYYLMGINDTYNNPHILSEEAAFILSIDKKLERYELVRRIHRKTAPNGEPIMVEPTYVENTAFGLRFLSFISLNEEKVAE